MLTNFKTLTKEGEARKRNRLIVEFLEKTDPKLYIKLFKKAQNRIENDNQDPLAMVNAYGLGGVPHHTSDKVYEELRKRRQLAVALKAKNAKTKKK